MGNAAVAEELADIGELDELYRLDATETEPEPDAEDDEEALSPEDESGTEIPPEGMPHP